MDEFKFAIESLEKSGAKQTTYWQILSAVSFGAIGAASSGKIGIYILIIGYLLFGISNLQAIVGFQKEMVLVKGRILDLLQEGHEINRTAVLVFECKKIVSVQAVFCFHVCVLVLISALMYIGHISS